jgi:hypothetical protein
MNAEHSNDRFWSISLRNWLTSISDGWLKSAQKTANVVDIDIIN